MIAVDATGLVCPACGSSQTEVKDSRPFLGGIRRRRLCLLCPPPGVRFSTLETVLGGASYGRARAPIFRALELLGEVDKLPAGKREIVLSLVAALVADEEKKT